MANTEIELPYHSGNLAMYNDWQASFENVTLKMTKSRYDVIFEVTRKDGSKVSLIASADRAFTFDADGIWFSTLQEYQEHEV